MEEIKNLKKDISTSLVFALIILVIFGVLAYLENSQGLLTNLFLK
jgi:hypothetical protein